MSAVAEILVDEAFRKLIPPLADHERDQLEENILAEGCRDPLVVWQDHGILIDGHNRYAICTARGVEYAVVERSFATRDDVAAWIIRNQFGRRNLTPFQRAELALTLAGMFAEKAKANQKTSKGRGKKGCQNSDNLIPVDTKVELAAIAGVSHDTIAKTKSLIEKADGDTLDKLRTGEVSLNKAYSDVRKKERKEENARKESEAAAHAAPSSDWTVTKSQAVVPCAAVITDPPYAILDEEWEPEDIEAFTREWASRWNTCGADFFLVFWSQRYLWDGRKWFDESLAGYEFQQLLVWHYRNNKSPQSRRGFKQTWEPVYFYRRKDCDREIRISGDAWGDDLHDFDCHVAAVPQSNFNGADTKQHPAQKPVAVMRWLINAATQPGELVCDPFCGSGTTGVAAVQLARKFHGIEISPEYRELSERRIAAYGTDGVCEFDDGEVSAANEASGTRNL